MSENEINSLVASVLNVNVNFLCNDSSQSSISQWDSLAQMNIITALEEKYSIYFDDSEIVEMLNLGLIQLIVKKKLEK